ncbi:hypothetical protein HPB48_008985 [Haemaphysalis longicornis]|uniref:Uncharacterized protein n=1 Tax=Haemaphysalis longicornis TaxID=44386 RepID=A0A9J6H294_HAELO|nr:hypothetical protein HPB48_008985 [Haemaphysalis longicornis]
MSERVKASVRRRGGGGGGGVVSSPVILAKGEALPVCMDVSPDSTPTQGATSVPMYAYVPRPLVRLRSRVIHPHRILSAQYLPKCQNATVPRISSLFTAGLKNRMRQLQERNMLFQIPSRVQCERKDETTADTRGPEILYLPPFTSPHTHRVKTCAHLEREPRMVRSGGSQVSVRRRRARVLAGRGVRGAAHRLSPHAAQVPAMRLHRTAGAHGHACGVLVRRVVVAPRGRRGGRRRRHGGGHRRRGHPGRRHRAHRHRGSRRRRRRRRGHAAHRRHLRAPGGRRRQAAVHPLLPYSQTPAGTAVEVGDGAHYNALREEMSQEEKRTLPT